MKTKANSLRLLARTLVLALTLLAAAALLVGLPTRAQAVFTFTLTETAGNVLVVGTGSLNTTGLTGTGLAGGAIAGIQPSTGFLRPDATNIQFFPAVLNVASFGPGAAIVTATNVVGDHVAVNGALARVYVPAGYVSGSTLNETATFPNQTFATLGFTPGTYTFSIGTGDTAIVTSVVPEPGTWALLGVGIAGLGVAALHRRSAAARA